MRSPLRLFLLFALLLLATVTVAPPPPVVYAYAPLSFDWICEPPDGVCDFTVTSNFHAMYQWNFGDGSSYGPTTSKSVAHDYDSGSGQHTVSLIGYATNPPSSPDNIIGCVVEPRFGSGPGGDPYGGITWGTCN